MANFRWSRKARKGTFAAAMALALHDAPIMNPEGAVVGQAGAFGLRAWHAPRKSGTFELDWQAAFPNAAVYEGLNLANNVLFKNASVIPTWYFGLMLASPTPSLSPTDVMNSHAGWVEDQDYTGGNRPVWVPGTSASGSLPTLTASSVGVTTDHFVRGAFLCSNITKFGTTGVLWATATEGANRQVLNGQTLQIYYTNTFTPVS